MRDKEKARQYNLQYRQLHRAAIRIKKRLYRRLPHVRKRIRQQRSRYHHEYYLKHRDKLLRRVQIWAQANKDKRRVISKRYKEKLKRKNLGHTPKIKRIVEEFIEYCKNRYKEETIGQYKRSMERFLKYLDRPGSRCKEYHLRRYYEHLKPSENKNPNWAEDFVKIRLMDDIDKELITRYVSYVNHDALNEETSFLLSQPEKETRLYPLKTFLLYCQRKGYIKEDYRKFIIVPAREKKILKRALTPDEMEKLLEAPRVESTLGIRDKALLELSYSGFRPEEMLSLKLGQVDVITNTVTILNGKGNKDRVIPMTNEAIYWVKRWLTRRPELIKNENDPGYLFITRGRKAICKRAFLKTLNGYAKKAKISINISPRDLRRTTATHLAENGAPIRLIQALLGHSTLKVTTKYLRLSDDRIKDEHKKTHPSNKRALYYAELHK